MILSKSKNIYLKKITREDNLSNYLEMVNDVDNINRIAGLKGAVIKKEDLIYYFENYNGELFSIFNNLNEHIGNIGLTNFDKEVKSCSLGIMMHSRFKGKGYGFEGMTLVLNFAFNNLDLNRIYLEVVEWNKAAIGLYKKVGFKEEGRHRKAYFSNDQIFDKLSFGLLKNGFKYLVRKN